MANARNITSANAIVTIAIPDLFSAPQQLQGFSAQNIFQVARQTIAETAMGLDGHLAAGMVFNHIEQSYSLMADSLSNDMFRQWAQACLQQETPFRCNGTTTLKAIGQSFILTNGVLVDWPPIPTAAKTLEAQEYTIRWERIAINPIAS